MGLARFYGDTHAYTALTKTGQVLGTPAYIAPELLQGHQVDRHADIYSLGCTLFEAVTGQKPFVGDSPVETLMMRIRQPPPVVATYREEVPDGLCQVIFKMMQRDPSMRFQTLAGVATTLAPFCNPRATRIITTSQPPNVKKQSVREDEASVLDDEPPRNMSLVGSLLGRASFAAASIAGAAVSLARNAARVIGVRESIADRFERRVAAERREFAQFCFIMLSMIVLSLLVAGFLHLVLG